jgi:hypothetical protein
VIRTGHINKTRWLLAINHFLKVSMEKGILDVMLSDRLGARDGDLKNKSDGGGLDARAERLIIVDARALRVAPDNPASLPTSKSVIRVEFVAKNPLVGNHVSMRWTRHERPGAVVKKSLIFLCHGRPPWRVLKSLSGRCWDDIKRCCNSR